MSVLMLEGV